MSKPARSILSSRMDLQLGLQAHLQSIPNNGGLGMKDESSLCVKGDQAIWLPETIE